MREQISLKEFIELYMQRMDGTDVYEYPIKIDAGWINRYEWNPIEDPENHFDDDLFTI